MNKPTGECSVAEGNCVPGNGNAMPMQSGLIKRQWLEVTALMR